MTEHIISVPNEHVSINISGLYLFNGFEIMEGFTDQMKECYYVFFYRDQFLTAIETAKIKRNSTLAEVLAKGIYIPSPSPIIPFLISANSIRNFSPLSTIWKTISKKYDDLEAAHILTIFDAYTKKTTIISLFEKVWQQLRRDGKLSLAYRILQLAMTRYPNNKWAKSLSANLEYNKYEQNYHSDIQTLLTYDPIHAEINLFSMLNDKNSFAILENKLLHEARHIERIALYYDKLNGNDEDFTQHYQNLLAILPDYFSKKEIASILYSIFTQSISTLNKETIKNDVLTLLAKNNQYEETFQLLTSMKTPLTSAQLDVLTQVISHLPSTFFINFTKFKANLLTNANPNQLQQLLTALIPKIFTNHDITFVYQWLEPLHANALPMIEKVKMMYKINDDPDQQHYLGEMYYQLNQVQQAIDCFTWDFELNPTNPRPIKWLSKLYREIGMKDEAESYLYLYKQMQKSS